MKSRIYLETGKESTPEFEFVKTMLQHIGAPTGQYEIVAVNGKDNLPNLVSKMMETTLEEGKNLIVFDADSPANGGGFRATQARDNRSVGRFGFGIQVVSLPRQSV